MEEAGDMHPGHDDGAFELRHPRTAHLRRQDSPRVLPMGPMPGNVYLDNTENHWQSCASSQGYAEHQDGLLNRATPGLPWLLVFDAASTHVATAFRKAMHSPSLCQIKCAYAPANTTSFSQPLDASVMKAFTRTMARHTNQHFAVVILDAYNGEGEIALDCSMMTLKAVLPGHLQSSERGLLCASLPGTPCSGERLPSSWRS